MHPVLSYVFGDVRDLAFYDWNVEEQGPGELDPRIIEWDFSKPLDEITERQHRRTASSLPRMRMLSRYRKGTARLFVMQVDGFPAAFETIQDWSLMKHELGWLKRPAPYLGPGWTDPDYRGQRLCAKLLLHMIHVLADNGITHMYGTVLRDNVPSRRMVERIGFRPMGVARVQRYACRLINHSAWLPDAPATVR